MALLRLAALFGPALMLMIEALRTLPGSGQNLLFVGSGLAFGLGLGVIAFFGSAEPPLGGSALICALPSLLWLRLLAPMEKGDGIRFFIEGLLAVFIVMAVAHVWLVRSGALQLRRARNLARQIKQKEDWPLDLLESRELPIVKAFREALVFDASPALELLRESHPGVRIAALSGLEYRTFWRSGQIDLIVQLFQNEMIPEVRVAAINALANIKDRRCSEFIADGLDDRDPRVRQSASDALFWDTQRRWAWIRHGVRSSLSDPRLLESGSLIREGQVLPQDAIPDLVAWVAERGSMSLRAAHTLGVHYARILQEKPDETSGKLLDMVKNSQTPALLRLHFARLLAAGHRLDNDTLESLLDSMNAAPLRQLAAEALLLRSRHRGALNALRDIARLNNRELALDTARIVQHCLNVDMGLALGQPLPLPNSPKAADVTRRLLSWATRADASDNALDSGGYRPIY